MPLDSPLSFEVVGCDAECSTGPDRVERMTPAPSSSSSSSSFIFKTRDTSKSIQIKAGTTGQETALTVALGIHINTSIKHYSSKAKHTVYEKH